MKSYKASYDMEELYFVSLGRITGVSRLRGPFVCKDDCKVTCVHHDYAIMTKEDDGIFYNGKYGLFQTKPFIYADKSVGTIFREWYEPLCYCIPPEQYKSYYMQEEVRALDANKIVEYWQEQIKEKKAPRYVKKLFK